MSGQDGRRGGDRPGQEYPESMIDPVEPVLERNRTDRRPRRPNKPASLDGPFRPAVRKAARRPGNEPAGPAPSSPALAPLSRAAILGRREKFGDFGKNIGNLLRNGVGLDVEWRIDPDGFEPPGADGDLRPKDNQGLRPCRVRLGPRFPFGGSVPSERQLRQSVVFRGAN